MLRRKALRKKSKKQVGFDFDLDEITPDLYERAESSCELMIPNVCAGSVNLHRHHRRSRRVRKDGLANDLSNLLLVCQPCHALIHHQPRWAKDHGFIISSNADPTKVHVNRSAWWNP